MEIAVAKLPMAKNSYPAKDGWFRATLGLTPGTSLTDQQVKDFCSVKNPNAYEFASIAHSKNSVKVIYRKHPDVVEKEEIKLLTPICEAWDTMLYPRACVIWQKEENHYRFEAWKKGRKIGSVRINSLHCHMKEAEIIEDAWRNLREQVIFAV